MAIKKPITKPASKVAAPASSKLKKRPREVEEDAEETTEEDDEPEETPMQRKRRLRAEAEAATAAAAKKKKKKVEADEEENEADVEEGEPGETAEEAEENEEPALRKGSKLKKKSKEKRSLADIFDSTVPGRGLMPAGDYKMKVLGYELEGEIADDPDDQGELKVKVTYEGHEDEEEGVAGKTISQWYQIADDSGEAGPGIPFLKGDLDILGYEEVVLADLEEIFADVAAEEPEVIVKVKQNGQYTNAYLQGLAETETD